MSTGLGFYYLTASVINAVASLYVWRAKKDAVICNCSKLPFTTSMLLLITSLFFVIMSALAMGGTPIGFPAVALDLINAFFSPITYSLGSFGGLVVLFIFRRFFSKPIIAWYLLNATLLLMGLSMTNPNFVAIVAKPDNVPIVAMVYLLGFFTWLATYQAVQNDDRIARGEPTLEEENKEKVLVWPDLVYTELICMIVLTIILLIWSVALQAPLEEMASTVKTPNPSKAPWYFLGLQEMLVYFDPWMAGVVLPSMVVFGLMSIPYIDFNKKGNGYYTISERMFSYSTFQIGFLALWVTLIILGTFLRGPNWNFFGPFEVWDAHKVEALNNIDLSDYVWVRGLNVPKPVAPTDADSLTGVMYILYRESVGLVLVMLYLIALPPLMAVTLFRKFYVKLGFIRYMVFANLLLFMAMLPIKMVLRWTLNLKYIIAIPEYFFNF